MRWAFREAIPVLAILAGVAAAAQQPGGPDNSAIDWRAAARQDISAAYQSYLANHPGVHDATNPGFNARLERARDAGLLAAGEVTDRAGYVRTLGLFSAEIEDGHALAFAKPPAAGAAGMEWPGFVAAWRGEAMIVHHAGPNAPAPSGAQVVACNGMPIRDFVLQAMRPRGLRPAEAGLWWFRAPQIFYFNAADARYRPSRCTFRTAAGERDAELNWSPVPPGYDPLLTAATDGERTAIGLTEPRPGLFLVGLPDFNPDAEGVAAYNRLYDTLRSRRHELAAARAVVLDLRHNNGGSSAWSRDVARILWGQEPVDRAMADYFRGVSIWWRASPDNIAYMATMEQRIRESGRGALADSTRANADGMRDALAQGRPFFVQPVSDGDAPAGPAPASDFEIPVYVIVPGRCASACLDALDVFTRFRNTILIGAPTSGDSTYMEVRVADLPSGQGRLVVPNKFWHARPRGSGEIYTPRIAMTAADWSTAAFLDRIERDLIVQ